MRFHELHNWNLSPGEARALQLGLAGQVKSAPLPRLLSLVAGADIAIDRGAGLCFAAVVVLRLPELAPVMSATSCAPLTFPYVPGLLSFREAPALLDAFRKLRTTPDAVIFDGQGIAHPRRLGLATHMGLWLGIPTVGCAKSRLIGEHAEPPAAKGSLAALTDHGEQIGDVLRTRAGVKPVFVSPGHLADFETSSQLVLRCCRRYRLPEPTRLAHIAAGRVKKGHGNNAG